MRLWLLSIFLQFAMVGTSPELLASDSKSRASINWLKEKGSRSIRIKILGLDEKQTTTLKSGFSTFSQIRIHDSAESSDEESEYLAQSACTVRYDMWEEHYEVTILSESPKTLTAKHLDSYISHCLSVDLYDNDLLDRLSKDGGTLIVSLQVEQISNKQAKKVKTWLINQQSSVMRGLFSHMLGDMTLSQTSQISLKIPPSKANP